jgi:hypothetical protein
MHFSLEAILIFLFYFSNYCIHFYLNGPNCSCLSFFLPILSVALSHGHELARATSCPMREPQGAESARAHKSFSIRHVIAH